MLPDEFRDWGAGEEEWHRVSANQQMDGSHGTGLVQLNLDGMQRSLHRQPRQVVQANSELPRSLLVVSPDRPGSAASGPSDEEQEVVGQTQRRPNTDRSCVVPSSWTIKTKTWGLRLLIEACLAEHEHETYNQE